MSSTATPLVSFGRALVCGFILLSAALPVNAGVNARQERQDIRIERGEARGQLSRCEAARLDARGDRIEHREQRYRASGGLQPAERVQLHRSLNRLSADIAEQRRDGRGCW
jgi:hypothetical protein